MTASSTTELPAGVTQPDQLERFIEDRDKLPKVCPTWCGGSHAQALEEGATLQEASQHYGPDFTVFANWDKRTETQSVSARLIADDRGHWYGRATVVLEADDRSPDAGRKRVEVPLDTGQVRVLARQLLHLADLADLQ